MVVAYGVQLYKFQSTHPTRGCDSEGLHCSYLFFYFNPRTPRGGATSPSARFSPHPYFNPRTPRGGATITRMIVDNLLSISIHAPHEGVRQFVNPVQVVKAISIHAPHEGVRRNRFQFFDSVAQFQSTHPTRGCDSSSSSSISSTS